MVRKRREADQEIRSVKWSSADSARHTLFMARSKTLARGEISIDRRLSVPGYRTRTSERKASKGELVIRLKTFGLFSSTRGMQAVACNPFGQCEYYRVNHIEGREEKSTA